MRRLCSVMILAAFLFGVICSSLVSVLPVSGDNALHLNDHHQMNASVSHDTEKQGQHEKHCVEYCDTVYLGPAEIKEKAMQPSASEQQLQLLTVFLATFISVQCESRELCWEGANTLHPSTPDLYAQTLRYRI